MRWCVLGNGSLYLGFDRNGWPKELFWPIVGLSNHLSEDSENRAFMLHEEEFSPIGGNDWVSEGKYSSGMSFEWHLRHKLSPVSLIVKDCVDPYEPVWVRQISAEDYQGKSSIAGFFFKQSYNLGENTVGECAFWDNEKQRLYHFKGSYWIGIEVQTGEKWVKAGAIAKKRDGGVIFSNETGGVYGRTIDHGLVESMYSVRCYGHEYEKSALASYYLAFGCNRQEVDSVLDKAANKGFCGIRNSSSRFWSGSFRRQEKPASFYDVSLKVISTHCDSKGGVLASCDTDIMTDFRDHYRYVWPRDAAMCVSVLIKAGLPGYGRRYLQFCSKAISDRGFFWQRYRPDGTQGSGWHDPNLPEGEYPIQQDQLSLSLVTVLDYAEATRDFDLVQEVYTGFIRKGAKFIDSYRTQGGKLVKPSFDLWEERRGMFTFTQVVSSLALMSAAKLAWLFGENEAFDFSQAALELLEGCAEFLSNDSFGFCRGIAACGHDADWTEDASLFLALVFIDRIEKVACSFFSEEMQSKARPLFDLLSTRGFSTWKRLEAALMVYTSKGRSGIARYTGDWYQRPEGGHEFPGNPWFVTTGWYVMSGLLNGSLDASQGEKWMEWFRNNSLGPGMLSEQLNGLTGEPISVLPLVWSHAAYVDLAHAVKNSLSL